MTNGDLKEPDEKVKTQQQRLRTMGPERRRVSFIRARNAQDKNTQKSMIIIAIVGILFLAITIQQWLGKYQASVLSSLGFLGGILIARVGFRYLQINRIQSNETIRSDDFTDEELTAYFREHEEINKRALEQWHRRDKYFALLGGGVLILLINLQSTIEFASIALWSGISIFFVGLVVFWIVQKQNRVKNATRKGG